jgi:hypothetical protein
MLPKCCPHFASILSACWFAASVRSDQRGRRGNVGQRASDKKLGNSRAASMPLVVAPAHVVVNLRVLAQALDLGTCRPTRICGLNLWVCAYLGALAALSKECIDASNPTIHAKKLQTVGLTGPSLPQVLGNLQGFSRIVALSTCGRRVLASRIDWSAKICATCLRAYMFLRAQRSSQTNDVG